MLVSDGLPTDAPVSESSVAGTEVWVEEWLAAHLQRQGLVVPCPGEGFDPPPDEDAVCPVLAWAGSGAMWLTGWPDGPPQWPAGDVMGALGGMARLIARLSAGIGEDPGPLDIGAVLTSRAVAREGTRQGPRSVGGRSRIFRTADGWLAVTLARPDDIDLLPALVALAGGREPGEWNRFEDFTRTRRAGDVMEAAQLLGLAAAEVATRREVEPPWSIHRLGETTVAAHRRPRVVDFSSLWAGPLCAHLLSRSGAEVVKVEDTGRPDAMCWGDPALYEQLHAGHERVGLDFRSGTGRRTLADLVEGADVVIEASRPRALCQLGLNPEGFFGSRPGRTWVSITARGRRGDRSNWVGFGDDAAAGGGLVAATDPRGPVFCADAIADPVTGISAAVGALASMANGGGHLVDCSMVASSAFVNAFGACRGEHRVEHRGPASGPDRSDDQGSGWFVSHGDRSRRVQRPRPTVEQASSMPPDTPPDTPPDREVGSGGTGRRREGIP